METYIVRVNGTEYEVEVEKKGAGTAPAASAAAPAAQAAPAAPAAQAAPAGSIEVTTGTAGKVWKIVSTPGDELEAGDQILILEAMKMEIPVVAPEKGKLAAITVKEGDEVSNGQVVATLA